MKGQTTKCICQIIERTYLRTKTHFKHKGRYYYILAFSALVFISPFKKVIFPPHFPMNFLIYFFQKESKSELPPPIIVTPLTENSLWIAGRNAVPGATVSIFIDQDKCAHYVLVANLNGTFRQSIQKNRLRAGDLIRVSQTDSGRKSNLSPAYTVLDSKLISWYEEREKSRVSSLDSTVNILLTWSVLIIGGLVYLTATNRRKPALLFLVVPILFYFILSIYYGVSCKNAITESIDKGISALNMPSVHLCWWNQIQSFEQAMFIGAIFILWNVKISEQGEKGGQIE
jgi:hypothetical protein